VIVRRALSALLSAGLVCLLSTLGAAQSGNIQHVLLISIDGMHALDVANYVQNTPGSALAELSSHGITYTNAHTPQNSDSFPGLLALITGGSPLSHGLFYDASYDRTVYAPSNVTCSGGAGNTMTFDESIDLYVSGVSQNVIDPTQLPRVRDKFGNCVPLYPHSAVRTNTIFEVAKSKGWHTAWEDKHPAYDIVNGPSGKGVDDLYTPEITNVGGLDNTHSVVCTVGNDQLKVQGIINEINGLSHDGKTQTGVPVIFGMNFQAVSVGQKLVKDNYDNSCVSDTDPKINQQPGGYVDGSGTPSVVLAYGLQQTDAALASIIAALKAANLYNSTLFIVTAKHGQSPINPAKVNKPGHFADLVAALPDAGSNPAALAIAGAANCPTGPCGFVQDDDIALIWLQGQNISSQQVTDYLNTNAVALFADDVMGGAELTLRFNDPAIDSRTPDIIVQPTYGTVYTHSSAKNAEHGGFSYGDTNVGLIVSNPAFKSTVLKTPVTTAQVAPSILHELGVNPNALKSVKDEKTEILPALP
jgi:Type I phosphodiesterase / nucleotide pyrophosphatase